MVKYKVWAVTTDDQTYEGTIELPDTWNNHHVYDGINSLIKVQTISGSNKLTSTNAMVRDYKKWIEVCDMITLKPFFRLYKGE